MLNCQLSKIKQIKELKCRIVGHYESIQNIVCYDKECANRGLICIYCLQTQHQNHRFMGVEQYIEQVMKFRQQSYQYSHNIDSLRKQLNRRYSTLQLKITDLATNLEILTHQIKQECEQDLNNLYAQSECLRLEQEQFIDMQDSEDVLSADNIQKFIDMSIKFINYSYLDQNNSISIHNFSNSISQLDIYQSRLDSIQEFISSSLKQVEKQQEYFTDKDIQNISNLEISPVVHTDKIQAAHFHRISSIVLLNHNCLYTSSHDGYIKKWDLKSHTCLKVLKSTFSKIWLALVHIARLNCLIALTNDNTLHVINPQSLKVTKRIQIPSSYSSCPLIVQVPGCNNEVAVATGSKIFIMDIFTGKVVHTTDTNGYYIYSFDIWTDGNYKYIIYGDKAGKLYSNEIKTQTEMPPIDKAHLEKIVDVKVLRDSNYVITASTDKNIKVWKMPVMQYIGGWNIKGFVDGIIPLQNMLIIKEREQEKLSAVYKDYKGQCKKKPFIHIAPESEGAFIISDINRSVISTVFNENNDSLPSSDIVIQYY